MNQSRNRTSTQALRGLFMRLNAAKGDVALPAVGRRRALPVSGWTLSGLTIVFCVFCATDGIMKILHPNFIIDSTNAIGWPANLGMLSMLAVLLLASTALYATPPTAVLGAIVLNGYLGGTVAAHARHLDPLFSHDLSGVYLGICAWGGLRLRDGHVRDLIPLRRRASSRLS